MSSFKLLLNTILKYDYAFKYAELFYLPSTFTLTSAVLVPLAFFTVRTYLPVSSLSQNLIIARARVLEYCKEYFSQRSSSFCPLAQQTFGSGLPPTVASRTRSDPALTVTVSTRSLLSSSAFGGAIKNK